MPEQLGPMQVPSHRLAVAWRVGVHLAAEAEVLHLAVVGFLDLTRAPKIGSKILQTLAAFHFHHPALALKPG